MTWMNDVYDLPAFQKLVNLHVVSPLSVRFGNFKKVTKSWFHMSFPFFSGLPDETFKMTGRLCTMPMQMDYLHTVNCFVPFVSSFSLKGAYMSDIVHRPSDMVT